MKTLNLVQGSQEWHDVRLQHFTASEAPAMMGASKYQTRDALLKMKATGIAPEVGDFKQSLFNKGHEAEASIRPHIEALIGEELYPVTGSIEIEGLKLLASFDGLTMMEAAGFEHKLWNESLAESVRNLQLEPHYYWQLEQQLLVSDADKIIFVVSDGTQDKCVWMAYSRVPGRREELIAGWKQFAIDLAAYVLPAEEAAKAIAEPVATLPAINYNTDYKTTGIELRSNIDAYKAAAMRLVEQSKKRLESDQDFANAEARIKACKDAEERIAAIQQSVIGEVADIDKFHKDLGAIAEMLRQCRLNEDKQVKARKDAIKVEIITAAQTAWTEHLNLINKALAVVKLPHVSINLQAAIKGLKTVASLQSKANDELARAKAEANQLAEKIQANVAKVYELAHDKMFLFADLQMFCDKDPDYVQMLIKERLAYHAEAERVIAEQAEQKRIAALQAAAAVTKAVADVPVNPAPIAEHFEQSFGQVFGNSTVTEYEQFASQSEEIELPFVDLSDYQKGVIAGLELALKINEKHASNHDFVKAVREFIECGASSEISKAA